MPKESGRFYTKAGETAYTIETAKGDLRATNIRDARKHGLLPSVTTVLGVMDRYGLNVWKQKQAIRTALTAPPMPQEDFDSQVDIIYEKATEVVSDAADAGTAIHADIERYFETGLTNNPALIASIEAQLEILGEQDWQTEKVCVGKGYAGKVDLHSKDWVIDFKTKEGDVSRQRCWDDHFRQVSAYAKALGCKHGAIMFISRDTYDCRLVPFDDLQFRKGWREFQAILKCYKVIKDL